MDAQFSRTTSSTVDVATYPDQAIRALFHEAGHAVIARHLGATINSIYVITEEHQVDSDRGMTSFELDGEDCDPLQLTGTPDDFRYPSDESDPSIKRWTIWMAGAVGELFGTHMMGRRPPSFDELFDDVDEDDGLIRAAVTNDLRTQEERWVQALYIETCALMASLQAQLRAAFSAIGRSSLLPVQTFDVQEWTKARCITGEELEVTLEAADPPVLEYVPLNLTGREIAVRLGFAEWPDFRHAREAKLQLQIQSGLAEGDRPYMGED